MKSKSPFDRLSSMVFSRRIYRCICVLSVLLPILSYCCFYYHWVLYLKPSGISFQIPSAEIKPDVKGEYLLLVVVTSTPTKRERRDLIRSTWGNAQNTSSPKRWKLIFNLGRSKHEEVNLKIEKEANTFHDILLGSFTDTYMNLIMKTFAAFSWAQNIKSDFILKADDDVYIRIPHLIAWLQSPRIPKNLYAGSLAKGTGIYRMPGHQHFISYRTYSKTKFHTYCRGPFYVLSKNVVNRIVRKQGYKDAFPIEDAYIGLLITNLGIEPVQIPGCFWGRPWKVSLSTCALVTSVCIGDSLKATDMEAIHRKYQGFKNINETELQITCSQKH